MRQDTKLFKFIIKKTIIIAKKVWPYSIQKEQDVKKNIKIKYSLYKIDGHFLELSVGFKYSQDKNFCDFNAAQQL